VVEKKKNINRDHNIHMFRRSKLYGQELLIMRSIRNQAHAERSKHAPAGGRSDETRQSRIYVPKTIAHQPIIRSHKSSYHPAGGKKQRVRLALAVTLALIVVFSATLGIAISISSKFALLETLLTMMSTSSFSGETNILVVGLDAGVRTHRSDTIMVMNVNHNTKKVSVVSIPRDTLMNVPGFGLTKVNHSFAYGGTSLAKKTLERFLGVKIPFTVAIDIDGLATVIDALGGITIDVERRMYYVDYAGGLYIDLYPGRQLLDGRKAIGYVRYRSDAAGDFGRISRQQKFVKALAERIITHKSALKAPRLIVSLLANIDTNMTTSQVLGMSMSMRQSLDIGNIEIATIPGSSIMIDNVYYLKPDLFETDKVVSRMLKSEENSGLVRGRFTPSVVGATL